MPPIDDAYKAMADRSIAAYEAARDEVTTEYEAIIKQIAKKRVDAYPFNTESFLKFAREHYPKSTDREHKLIASAIYRWFYGGSGL